MAEKLVYRCIICQATAEEKPPRRCPTCGAPAARWRLVADRSPSPVEAPSAEQAEADPHAAPGSQEIAAGGSARDPSAPAS